MKRFARADEADLRVAAGLVSGKGDLQAVAGVLVVDFAAHRAATLAHHRVAEMALDGDLVLALRLVAAEDPVMAV